MNDECSRCKFFERSTIPRNRDGQCRRHAPSPNTGPEEVIAAFLIDIHYNIYSEVGGKTPGTSGYSHDNLDGLIHWPMVFDSDWCGEFIEKPPAPGANEEDGQ